MSSDPPLPATAEAVLTFLESVGRRSEAELYLRLFRKIPRHSFAIIAAEAPVVRRALGSVLEQLRFLKELGLFAPVVVGLFDPSSARRGAEQLARRLTTVGLCPALHVATQPDLARSLRDALDHEQVPIVRFDPQPDQRLGDRFAALGVLASELGTRRVVMVRRQGGLRPRSDDPLTLPSRRVLELHGEGVSVINLRTDLDELLEARVLPPLEEELLQHSHRMLRSSGERNLTISVTSPLNLLRELFTVKGAGTLIKIGSEIARSTTYASLDEPQLRALLEASFGRRLAPDFLKRPPLAVYLERDYRGVAILEPSPIAPYLSKFAVEPLARGEGIGQDLWQALTHDHPALVWRCRPQNPILSWYLGVCDGMLRLPDWHVFWRGLDPDRVPAAIQEARSRPHDF